MRGDLLHAINFKVEPWSPPHLRRRYNYRNQKDFYDQVQRPRAKAPWRPPHLRNDYDYRYGHREEERCRSTTSYQTEPSFVPQYYSSNSYMQHKGVDDSPKSVGTSESKKRVHEPERAKKNQNIGKDLGIVIESMMAMDKSRITQREVESRAGDEPLQQIETPVHEEEPKDKPPMCSEEPKTEPCEAQMIVINELGPEEEEKKAMEPKFNSRPSIKPSSLTSLATPWMDATPMVPTSIPFIIQEVDQSQKEEVVSTPKSSKEVFVEPNLSFFLPRCLCKKKSPIEHFMSCCLHLVFHDHVYRKLKLLHVVSSHKTMYSFMHCCSYSQFLLHDTGNIICTTFVAKNIMCISCAILRHIFFRKKLGNTPTWIVIRGFSMKLIMPAYALVVLLKDTLLPHFPFFIGGYVNSRTNLLQEGEDDMNRYPPQAHHGKEKVHTLREQAGHILKVVPGKMLTHVHLHTPRKATPRGTRHVRAQKKPRIMMLCALRRKRHGRHE